MNSDTYLGWWYILCSFGSLLVDASLICLECCKVLLSRGSWSEKGFHCLLSINRIYSIENGNNAGFWHGLAIDGVITGKVFGVRHHVQTTCSSTASRLRAGTLLLSSLWHRRQVYEMNILMQVTEILELREVVICFASFVYSTVVETHCGHHSSSITLFSFECWSCVCYHWHASYRVLL